MLDHSSQVPGARLGGHIGKSEKCEAPFLAVSDRIGKEDHAEYHASEGYQQSGNDPEQPTKQKIGT